MMQSSIWILALAYLVGLMASAVPWGAYVLCGLGAIATLTIRRFWRTSPSPVVWLFAVGISLAASFYVQLRSPSPSANDISQWLNHYSSGNPTQALVTGTVTGVPRLTRAQKAQIWIDASHVTPLSGSDLDAGKDVEGQLYVTVPLLQATGIYPGQLVNAQGRIYQPSPGGGRCLFDFQDYLARNGSFAGLAAQTLDISPIRQPSWGGWQLQRKIVRSLTQGLGVPVGPLMSAMVIGNQTVDIPFDVRDAFVRSGLSHALAASGFQVSLILGVVLALTARFSTRVQGITGAVALIFFLALSGFQPSVVRAVLMGFAVLVGVVSDRKIKPLNALLVVAVAMLIVNPNWIWDIGFQFSFLATLGLLVTASALTERMDWMPPIIAAAIAVPIAATIWTLPVQIYSFCLVSPYSLLANIITAPLIVLVSLWGFASALLGLVWEPFGSFAAWILYYPTLFLIQIVQGFSTLPGSLLATGTISILQLIGVYAIWIGIWKIPKWQKRWMLAGGIAIALLVIPTVSVQAAKVQITVLDNPNPVVVLQDHGEVGLLATGALQNPEYSVLPFLRQQGINRIDIQSGLQDRDRAILARSLQFPDQLSKPYNSLGTSDGSNNAKAMTGTNISVGWTKNFKFKGSGEYFDLEFQDTHWSLHSSGKIPQLGASARNTVLLWSGKAMDADWLQKNPLKAAIATGRLDEKTAKVFEQQKIPLYSVQELGAIAWTPDQGITPLRDLETKAGI